MKFIRPILCAAVFCIVSNAIAQETTLKDLNEYQKGVEDSYAETKRYEKRLAERIKNSPKSKKAKVEKGCQYQTDKTFLSIQSCKAERAAKKSSKQIKRSANQFLEKSQNNFGELKSIVSDLWGKALHLVQKTSAGMTLNNLPPSIGTRVSYFITAGGDRPEINFQTGSTMTDPDGTITEVEWIFGDGTSMVIPRNELNGRGRVMHYYSGPGTYTVTVKVKDNLGAITQLSRTITFGTVELPRPNFTTVAGAGNAITFSGTPTDIPTDKSYYEWNMGDGTIRSGDSLSSVTHTYSAPGAYEVTLLVDTIENGNNSITKKVFVNQTPPAGGGKPGLVLDSSNRIGAAPHTVTFDASGSVDEESSPANRYEWEFGDGSSEMNYATGEIASHTYKRPGTYYGKLKVFDAHGNFSEKSFHVFVTAPTVLSPIINVFQWGAPLEIDFEGDAYSMRSTAPGNAHYWNYGDGSALDPGNWGWNEYNSSGTYNVTLAAHDVQGFRRVVSKTITLSGGNDEPDIGLEVEEWEPQINQSYNYSGEDSGDPQQSLPLNYAWDMGDGSYLSGSSYDSIDHTYSEVGVFPIRLVVTNSRGISNEAFETVTARDGWKIASIPNFSPKIGVAPLNVTFDSSQSWAQSGNILERHWQFRGQFKNGEEGLTATRTYTQTGQHGFSLLVKDDQGNEAVEYGKVTVVNAAQIPPGNLPPVASFEMEFDNSTDGHTFYFDASSSSDPDGEILYWEWELNGSLWRAGKRMSGKILLPRAEVKLTVYDEWGAKSSFTRVFETRNDQFYDISMLFSPAKPIVNKKVYFSAEDSNIPGVDVSTYEWDFGDGSQKKYSELSDHVFVAAGTYTVTLRVEDLSHNIRTKTMSVVVADPELPVAQIQFSDKFNTATATNGQVYRSLRFPEKIIFSAGDSISNVGIEEVNWDFGDGELGFGIEAEHTYYSPGTYTVSGTLRDKNGNVSEANGTVVISDRSCRQSMGMNTCLFFDGINGNTLPMSASAWTISHDLGNLEISDDPADLQDGWYTLTELNREDSDPVVIDLSDVANILGATVQISKSNLITKGVNFNKSYRLEMRVLSTSGEEINGMWPDFNFGQGSISIQTLENDVELIVTHLNSGKKYYKKMGVSNLHLLTDLSLGEYSIFAKKGERSDTFFALLNHSSVVNVVVDISPARITVKQNKTYDELLSSAGYNLGGIKSSAEDLAEISSSILHNNHYGKNLENSKISDVRYPEPGECGQRPPSKEAPEWQSEFPSGYGWFHVFDANSEPRDLFISQGVPREFIVACYLSTFPVSFQSYKWYLRSYRECISDPSRDLQVKYQIEGYEEYLRDTIYVPLRLTVDVVDGVSKKSELKIQNTFSTSSIMSENGWTIHNASSKHGTSWTGIESKQYLMSPAYYLPVTIPSNIVDPRFKVKIETASGIQQSCLLFANSNQESSIEGITSASEQSVSLLSQGSEIENAQKSLDPEYGLFPVHYDNENNSPDKRTLGANVFKAKYKVTIKQQSSSPIPWTGVAVSLKYGNTTTAEENFVFLDNPTLDSDKKLAKGEFELDIKKIFLNANDTPKNNISWDRDYDSVEIWLRAYDNLGNYTPAFKLPRNPLAMFNAKHPSVTSKVCNRGFYSTARISAFGQGKLFRAMEDLKIAGAGILCNDMSLPFGGEFKLSKKVHPLGPIWDHSDHEYGTEADIRYFNISSQVQDGFDRIHTDEEFPPSDHAGQSRRMYIVDKYMQFSNEAKIIGTATNDPPSDAYNKRVAIHAFCNPSGENNSVAPCSELTEVANVDHNTVLAICQIYRSSPLLDNVCPTSIEIAEIKEYSQWVEQNFKVLDYSAASLFSFGISPGESRPVSIPLGFGPIFENWQNAALKAGLWPDGKQIYKVLNGNLVLNRIDDCYSFSVNVSNSMPSCPRISGKIRDIPKDHFNHMHIGVK